MKVPQFEPYLGQDEYEAIKPCFDTNWVTEGPKSKLFVKKICEKIGVKYGVLAPNGTLALYLGLKAINIQEKDLIIVPNFTFIASATAIQMAGGIPVFFDIENDNLQLNVDPNDEKQLEIGQKCQYIMPVHLYGFTPNMENVEKFAKKCNLTIIEDACQGFGVKWRGKPCGSFGKVSCFSFFADKTITTGGEGGFVGTNDEETYEKLQYLRNQGRLNRGSFIHPQIGYNFRMTDIQSAIGLKQLEKMDEIVSKKLHIFNLYKELLKDIDNIALYTPNEDITSFVPFRVVMKVVNEVDSIHLMKFMQDRNIEPRTFFYPLDEQPAFDGLITWTQEQFNIDLQNTKQAYQTGVCLPSFPALTDEQVKYVCEIIKSYYMKN